MNFERIEQLVHDALARPEEDRALFLEGACGDDVALRREVESLLRHQPSATDLFEASAFEWTSVLSLVDQDATRVDDDLETHVGPYRLIEKIGSGGMGNVYKAVRDDDEFEQTVAIKRIKRGLDTDEILRRFRQERQVLANLTHPNIARLLDGGSTGDGRPYLVIEYVDGRRIDEYCDEHGLTIRERIELFRVVCDAVQFAHRNLVVHRDLKPGNILVEEGIEGSRHQGIENRSSGRLDALMPRSLDAFSPKLLDFGIAKLLHPDSADATLELTAGTGPRLTLAYASPEQVRGEAITTSSDVYSLGVILYELLIGTRPYEISGLSAKEIERAICESPPRPPAEALAASAPRIDAIGQARSTDPARLRRELSGDLETILFKALAKEPERRYISVQALSEDLHRYLEGRPVTAQRDSAAYRLRKFVARNKAGVSVAIAFVILLAGAAVVSTFLFLDARSARDRAERQQETAEAINAFLTDMLASVDPRIEGVDVTVRMILDSAAERADTEFTEFAEVEQGVQSTVGRAYFALGLYDDAYPHLDRALDLCLDIYGNDHPRTATAMNDLGLALRHMGRYAEAEPLHRAALDIDIHHFGEFSREAAKSMNDLAQNLYDQGKYEEGRPLYVRSFEIRSELLGEADTEFLASLNNFARARLTEGDSESAEAILLEVLRLRRELDGDDHPDTIGAMNNAAFILMQRGRYDEAEDLFYETIVGYESIYGPSHPDIARVLNNLGECLRRQGRYEDAEPVQRDALAMRREALGDDHPLVAVSINNLGLTLASLEAYDEAIALHEESLAIRTAHLGADHPDTATSLANLGFVLYKQGDIDSAQTYFLEALEIRRNAFGEAHPAVANAKMHLARCLLEQGDLGPAETQCREALAIQTRTLGPDHPHTAATRAVLGRVLTRAERYDDAETALLAAWDNLQTGLGDGAPQLDGVARDLTALYERWGRTEEATRWRSVRNGE